MAAFDYAVKDGFAKGEAKGEVKGRAEGRAEGRTEERAELVSNMFKSGMSIANIAACTGLPEEELVQLINMNGTQPLA